MTTLVTGANGFLGSAVVRLLLNAGHGVRVLHRATSDQRNLDGLAVEHAIGDLRDLVSLRVACDGCRYVFHVAADYRLWTLNPTELYASNVAGTENVLTAAADAGVERIVYTSSVATLGINPDRSPASETTPVTLGDMIGDYKRSKFLAEEAVHERVQRDGCPVVIVNPSTPVGPRDVKPTPTGRVILDAAAGRMPAYVDTGLNIAHVDDVAAGHLLALAHGQIGERYILGGQDLTLKRILDLVAAEVGRPAPRIRLAHNLVMPIAYLAEWWARVSGHGEPLATIDGVRMSKKHMYFSSAKAIATLGYSARQPVDGIRDAVAWFRTNQYF